MIASQPATARGRIPSLDGWRGIAIALVLVEHVQTALTGRYLNPWLQTGQHGVTIFFVLSGFLITSRLMEGPIDLRRFYIRRFFRLMPAAWAYLAFLWLLNVFYHGHVLSLRETVSCLLFYRNYFGPSPAVAGHFWSLSMEEQFYMVWPLILVLIGVRRARWVAIFGALACAAYRFARWEHYDRIWLSFHTEVRADAILVGCLLALLFENPRFREEIQRWSKLYIAPALAILLFCMVRYHWLPTLYEDVCIAMLIAASTLHPQGSLARLLSTPALVWLGAVSYSIYVWQQFFIIHRNFSATITLMCVMPLFAIGSYYWIERPCVRIGHRLTSSRRERSRLLTSRPDMAFTSRPAPETEQL